ncbi:hypothetical protein EK904_008545 [Melospiza melodia maxima]|nr:hypothetical protein EK904_008545 [Melospiza melodia maxima]
MVYQNVPLRDTEGNGIKQLKPPLQKENYLPAAFIVGGHNNTASIKIKKEKQKVKGGRQGRKALCKISKAGNHVL